MYLFSASCLVTEPKQSPSVGKKQARQCRRIQQKINEKEQALTQTQLNSFNFSLFQP
jgi:hypothetical protein